MKMGDQEPTGSSSNRNGRYAKKPKSKKVPQRGLGVAQLEKIRLEEEVKNDTANLQPLAVTSHPFARHNRPYSFLNDNPYGHVSCNPHLTMRNHSIGTVSATPSNIAGADNNLLSSTYIQEVDKAARFLQNPNPLYELKMLMSPFGVLLLGNQPTCSFSSLMMNDVAENSSSAVLNSQTEPPSSQSPYGTYRFVQPDEAEKMVGTKRPCPFSREDPSNTLLHCKSNPFSVQSSSGSLVIKGNSSFSDGMLHSISTSNSNYTKDNRAENVTTTDGDFLKLASPVAMSLFPSSKSKQALPYHPHAHQAELLKQNSTTLTLHQRDLDSELQTQRQSFYTFLPEHNIAQDGQWSVITSHQTDKECLDLSLKL